MIRTISTHGDRICVGDMTQSFIFLKYTKDRNELLMFADDSTPRYTTCGTLVDYQTIAGGDKFGNMFVLRLPDQLLDDGTATSSASTNSMEQSLWDANPVHGASNKLIQLNQYYIGDIMTSITKTSVVTGAKEVLLYSTIQGRIGIFLPMLTRSDVEFFQNLELNIRKECSTLSGWSHFAYRSYYIPLREVVDGSLCEMFFDLSLECQTNIANNMEREIDDIKKKIEDQRQRAL
jgi:splicing factor 3B subunit 3